MLRHSSFSCTLSGSQLLTYSIYLLHTHYLTLFHSADSSGALYVCEPFFATKLNLQRTDLSIGVFLTLTKMTRVVVLLIVIFSDFFIITVSLKQFSCKIIKSSCSGFFGIKKLT